MAAAGLTAGAQEYHIAASVPFFEYRMTIRRPGMSSEELFEELSGLTHIKAESCEVTRGRPTDSWRLLRYSDWVQNNLSLPLSVAFEGSIYGLEIKPFIRKQQENIDFLLVLQCYDGYYDIVMTQINVLGTKIVAKKGKVSKPSGGSRLIYSYWKATAPAMKPFFDDLCYAVQQQELTGDSW